MIQPLLDIYIVILFVHIVLSYLPGCERWHVIGRIADWTCGPVKKKLPPGLPIDFSPFIVIAGIIMLRFLLDIYIVILFVHIVLSYLPGCERWHVIRRMADWTCGPVRKRLPRGLPIDFSPFIVIAGIILVQFLW